MLYYLNESVVEVRNEDLQMIEKCILNLKIKNSINANLNKIGVLLSKITPEKKYKLIISDNDSGAFYGMSVFPANTHSMDRIISKTLDFTNMSPSVISKEISDDWRKIIDWVIDIDSNILYDMKLNANPSEILAVLLHEIGHVIYSDEVPQRVFKIIRYQTSKLNYNVKQMLSKVPPVRRVFNISLLDACAITSYDKTDMGKEKAADMFAVKMGYGASLNNFIDKILIRYGNGNISKSNKEKDADVKSVTTWAVVNINELEFRKTGLKNALKVELMKNPSVFIKTEINALYKSLFGGFGDQVRKVLSESYYDEPVDKLSEMMAEENLTKYINKALTESITDLFDSFGKVKKVNQVDIDILEVEKDKIESHNDKIYLLDRIYFQLDLVNISLDMINMGKEKKISQSKLTLTRMKDQLERLRGEVIATRIIDKEYGVFIKYPKGYQG